MSDIKKALLWADGVGGGNAIEYLLTVLAAAYRASEKDRARLAEELHLFHRHDALVETEMSASRAGLKAALSAAKIQWAARNDAEKRASEYKARADKAEAALKECREELESVHKANKIMTDELDVLRNINTHYEQLRESIRNLKI